MNIYLSILLLLFIPTIVCGQNKDCLRKELPKYYNLNDSTLKIWREDTSGCKNKRGQYSFSFRRDSLLIGMPVDIVLLLFGNPDENITADVDYHYSFLYNCGTACDAGNKLKPNEQQSDATFQKVYFEFYKDKLTGIDIVVL